MSTELAPVAVVDYGLGNLFSVKHACEHAGLTAIVTASRHEILAAPAVILPGIGAFAGAMQSLEHLDLVEVLRDVVAAGTPLLGVCLGMQLLMSESEEFGRHRGLDLLSGDVVRLPGKGLGGERLKVPHVGWSAIHAAGAGWSGTLLDEVTDGDFMYFVHSYYVRPAADVAVATTTYGATSFCSAVRRGNVFGCQFHPERSGEVGLGVYRSLARQVALADGVRRG